MCGSGLKTAILAAQAITAGDADCIIAGGMESMTNAPYVLDKVRQGLRMGNSTVVDSMVNDGLTDAFNNYHMGITAENLAEKYNLTREEQDAFYAPNSVQSPLLTTALSKKKSAPYSSRAKKATLFLKSMSSPPRRQC